MYQYVYENSVTLYLLYMQVVATLRYIQDEKERKRILHRCHVHPTLGHLGLTKTLYRLRERYMWHGYVKDSKMVCSFVYKGYFKNYYYYMGPAKSVITIKIARCTKQHIFATVLLFPFKFRTLVPTPFLCVKIDFCDLHIFRAVDTTIVNPAG